MEHAQGFAIVDPPVGALDLGSGGGVPGLVLALHWPASDWVLLDANDRRAAFLEGAVAELELVERVRVVRRRAEEAGHDRGLRSSFDLVTARSFGPPAVTSECASAFLQVNGSLIVSEPPEEAADRWPVAPLAALGLRDLGRHGRVRLLRQTTLAPATVPRRVGVPAKRPLW